MTPTYSGLFIRPSSLKEYTPASRSSGMRSISIKSFGEQVSARSVFQRVGQSAGCAHRPRLPPVRRSCWKTGTDPIPPRKARHAQRPLPQRRRPPSFLAHSACILSPERRAQAHVLHQPSALRVVDRHLCAGMQHQMGIALLNDPRHAHILHQHGVHTHIGEQVETSRRSSSSHCLTSVLTVT